MHEEVDSQQLIFLMFVSSGGAERGVVRGYEGYRNEERHQVRGKHCRPRPFESHD